MGCAKLYEAASCSKNTSPVFLDTVATNNCGPVERCERIRVNGTGVWVEWMDQRNLKLGIYGFYDKNDLRKITNVNLVIKSHDNPEIVFKNYSSQSWENGNVLFKLAHKIKPTETYELTFDLTVENESRHSTVSFRGFLEKGVVRTCVPLV